MSQNEVLNQSEALKKISVLFVEDDILIKEEVAKSLRRRCKEVHEAANGEEGLELYLKHRPDIVITDVEMPRMDGMEMINRIIAVNAAQTIILLTGYDDESHRSDKVCMNLVKPVRFEHLLDAIVQCTDRN